jgi:hypothetical protein
VNVSLNNKKFFLFINNNYKLYIMKCELGELELYIYKFIYIYNLKYYIVFINLKYLFNNIKMYFKL